MKAQSLLCVFFILVLVHQSQGFFLKKWLFGRHQTVINDPPQESPSARELLKGIMGFITNKPEVMSCGLRLAREYPEILEILYGSEGTNNIAVPKKYLEFVYYLLKSNQGVDLLENLICS